MERLKALQEKRGNLAANIREMADALNDEKPDFTPDEETRYQELNDELNAVNKQMEIHRQAAEAAKYVTTEDDGGDAGLAARHVIPGMENRDNRPPDLAEQRKLAFAGWCAYQMDQDVTQEQQRAADAVGLRLHQKRLGFDLLSGFGPHSKEEIEQRFAQESRAQSATIGSGGGYLVPRTLASEFEAAMLWYGGMMQVSQVIRTATGEDFHWPGANDTGNSGSQVGENAAVSTTDVTFSEDIWRAYKYTSDMVKVPYELLEDSSFDIPAILGQMLGERIGRILNTKFTTGSGAATPNGIVTASTAGKTAASGTAVTTDEILDLLYSVDIAYRPNASFMMNDGIIKAIRKLKNGGGEYLLTESNNAGEPAMLFNYPVIINNDMQATLATTTKTILFGDLSKYKIRMVRGVRFYRLEERFRDNDQDGFVAFLRADGNLLNSGGNPVKHLVQA